MLHRRLDCRSQPTTAEPSEPRFGGNRIQNEARLLVPPSTDDPALDVLSESNVAELCLESLVAGACDDLR
jgi:hypothetical protein